MKQGRYLGNTKQLLLVAGMMMFAWRLEASPPVPVADTIKGAFIGLSVDRLGFIYGITKNFDLIKFDLEGKELFRYSNKTLGRLEVVDASNPFTLLLFYPDQQTVVLLDRTMNERSRLSFAVLGLLQVRNIALADDNQIWIFDEASAQLKKIASDGTVVTATDDLRLLTGLEMNPTQLFMQDNRIWLNQPDQGVLVFDRFGRLEAILPVKAAIIAAIQAETLLVFQENEWKIYRADAPPIPWPGLQCSTPSSLRMHRNRLIYLDNGNIVIRLADR